MKITLTKNGETILENEEVEEIVLLKSLKFYKTNRSKEFFLNLGDNEGYEVTTEDGEIKKAHMIFELGKGIISCLY